MISPGFNLDIDVNNWSSLCLKMRAEDIITGNVKYIQDEIDYDIAATYINIYPNVDVISESN